MREAQLDALMKAGNFTLGVANEVLDNLEAQGLTIYKKKVSTNGRRPATSTPMSPELAKAIRIYHGVYPDTTQQEIANKFNVNIGRVNEALRM
jgi:hypothetical protein